MARFTAIAIIAIAAFSLTGMDTADPIQVARPADSPHPIEEAETQAPAVDPTPPTVGNAAVAAVQDDARRTIAEDPTITWARSRFKDAGLELPNIEIVVFDSTIDCDGRVGYYYADAGRLELCRLDKKTVLHELAHAWANHNLTAENRAGFVRLRNLTSWNDDGEPWKHRATEHAAETISWALMDRETTVPWVSEDGAETRRLLTIDNSSPRELTEAYRFLTGLDLHFDRSLGEENTVRTVSPELLRAGQ